MFIDCHTHILNGIDDGPQNIEESYRMIDEEITNGTTAIWFTPHFNAKYDSFEKFISVRDKAAETIAGKYSDFDISFIIASEVMLCDELFLLNDINALCINGGGNILVEFSFGSSITDVKRMLNKLICSYGKTPIIAHIERFKEIFYSNKEITNLISMGCKLQMNTKILESSILDSYMAFKRIQKEEIMLLGTDCHNMGTRPPNFVKAINNLSNVLGNKALDRLNRNAVELVSEYKEKRIFV